jgi:hypothetical protein
VDAILQPILQSPKLPDYVEELKRVLEEEEKRRKEFYEWLDEDKRTEFIGGQVVIHSLARAVHIEVLQSLLLAIVPFVQPNKLGKVYTQQALIKLKRSDVMPDLAFWKIRLLQMKLRYFRFRISLSKYLVIVLKKTIKEERKKNML